MKVVRYLLIATAAGAVIAALNIWQQQSSSPQLTKRIADTAVAAEPSARQPDAPPPASKAHRNAAQTFAELLKLPSQFEQSAQLYQMVRDSNTKELVVLIDEADKLASQIDRAGALQILLSRYVEIDPLKAIARAETINSGSDQQLTMSVYLTWIRNDPEAALSHLRSQPLSLRSQIASMLNAINQRYRDDSFAGIALALVDSDQQGRSAANALAKQAKENPAAAWSEALALTNLQKRRQALQRVLGVWAHDDPQAALNALANLPSHQRNRLQVVVVRVWLQQRPDAAIAWVSAQPPGPRSNQLYQLALSQIAQTDITKALTIANGLPDGQRQNLIDQTLGRLARNDPARAIAELNTAGIDLANSRTYAQILSQGKLYSFEESLDRANQIEPEQRQQVQQQLFRRWADQDPQAAAAHLDTVTNPNAHRQAASQVLRRWANADPQAAANWIATAPEAQRNQLQQQLVNTISHIDPDAALGYLADITSPAIHDQAAVSILTQLIFDLPAADTLLQKMQTDSGRQQGAALIYQMLKQTHSSEAERYRPAAEAAASSKKSTSRTVISRASSQSD